MHFGNDRALLSVFRQNMVPFVVKHVKTLRFDDLAIVCGVNVFANLCILFPDLLCWLPFFGDQNEVTLGFEQSKRFSDR